MPTAADAALALFATPEGMRAACREHVIRALEAATDRESVVIDVSAFTPEAREAAAEEAVQRGWRKGTFSHPNQLVLHIPSSFPRPGGLIWNRMPTPGAIAQKFLSLEERAILGWNCIAEALSTAEEFPVELPLTIDNDALNELVRRLAVVGWTPEVIQDGGTRFRFIFSMPEELKELEALAKGNQDEENPA